MFRRERKSSGIAYQSVRASRRRESNIINASYSFMISYHTSKKRKRRTAPSVRRPPKAKPPAAAAAGQPETTSYWYCTGIQTCTIPIPSDRRNRQFQALQETAFFLSFIPFIRPCDWVISLSFRDWPTETVCNITHTRFREGNHHILSCTSSWSTSHDPPAAGVHGFLFARLAFSGFRLFSARNTNFFGTTPMSHSNQHAPPTYGPTCV